MTKPTFATALIFTSHICVYAELIANDIPGPSSSSEITTNEKLICEPFGTCERCPDDVVHEPYCQPFGNRRLLHCRVEGAPVSEGERPVFGPCGRIVAQERADFFEFVFCNVVFACLGLLVLFARSRRLAEIEARTLAARIRFQPATPREV